MAVWNLHHLTGRDPPDACPFGPAQSKDQWWTLPAS
jgi:hypothetical protein